MRRLVYVPILHSEVDMGSVGAALAQAARTRAGKERWERHQQTVARFWEAVAAYLRSLDPRQLVIYQDGLAAGGEVGSRVVREAAARGSQNYQLIVALLDRGAELRQTEDPKLLLRERELLRAALKEEDGSVEYRSHQDRLTVERDSFIAATIDATLREGEVGVLFMGAAHDVLSLLPPDIAVAKLKEPARVREYLEALLAGRGEARVEELGAYLGASILGGGL